MGKEPPRPFRSVAVTARLLSMTIRRAFGRLIRAGVLVSLAGCSTVQSETLDMVNGPAPDIRLSLASGEYVALSSFRGKRVVLGFWDSRCPTSQGVIEDLNEYAGRAAHKRSVVFFDVNIDDLEHKEWRQSAIENRNLHSIQHVYSGNGPLDEAFMMFKLSAIPVVVVIGPSGIVESVTDDADAVAEFVQ